MIDYQTYLDEYMDGEVEAKEEYVVDSEEEAPVGNVEFEGCEYYLNVMETKIKEKSVISRTMAPVSQKIREKEQEESLPSFLRGNLWIEMLSKRTD